MPIFYFICDIFSFLKTKTIKNSRIVKKFVDLQNFMKIEFCWILIFEILIIHKPSLESCEIPHKNGGRIGSAILTFIRYKQTGRQTDKQSIFRLLSEFISKVENRMSIKGPFYLNNWWKGLLKIIFKYLIPGNYKRYDLSEIGLVYLILFLKGCF